MQHQTVPQTEAGTVRVAFDVMAGIEPIIMPATSTAAEIAEIVTAAFAAAEVPIAVKVTVDLEGDAVTVSEGGEVIEHGSISRVDEQPQTEVDPRRVAYEIATGGVAAGLPIPAAIEIPGHYNMFIIRLPQNDRAGVDAWAKRLGLADPELDSSPVEAGAQSYGVQTYHFPVLPGWTLQVRCWCVEGGAR